MPASFEVARADELGAWEVGMLNSLGSTTKSIRIRKLSGGSKQFHVERDAGVVLECRAAYPNGRPAMSDTLSAT
jgi:hypothetical protein